MSSSPPPLPQLDAPAWTSALNAALDKTEAEKYAEAGGHMLGMAPLMGLVAGPAAAAAFAQAGVALIQHAATLPRTPTAAEIKEISDKIDAGKHQEAIDLAIKYYNLDVSAVNGSVTYDSSVSGEGATGADRSLAMGDAAFKWDGKTSPAWLASSILHEAYHCKQIKERGTGWIDNDQMRYAVETEAYDQEILHAEATGLTKEMLDENKKRRDENYYDNLTEENKKLVDAGKYAEVK